MKRPPGAKSDPVAFSMAIPAVPIVKNLQMLWNVGNSIIYSPG